MNSRPSQILRLIAEPGLPPGDRMPTGLDHVFMLFEPRSTCGDRRGLADGAIAEHDAICRAIRDGEPEAAAQPAAVHLDNTLEDYRREIQRRIFG